jgi:hypothetical protein
MTKYINLILSLNIVVETSYNIYGTYYQIIITRNVLILIFISKSNKINEIQIILNIYREYNSILFIVT